MRASANSESNPSTSCCRAQSLKLDRNSWSDARSRRSAAPASLPRGIPGGRRWSHMPTWRSPGVHAHITQHRAQSSPLTASSDRSGDVGPTGPSFIREAAHRRLNRGTRTRLRRVKTRQLYVAPKRTGATAASGAATSAQRANRGDPPASANADWPYLIPHRPRGRADRRQLPRATARLPERSDPATVRQEATHASGGYRAREVEPGGPGNRPLGPRAHSSKHHPDAIHRRFHASMRNRDGCDMDRMRQGIPRGFNGATTTCNGANGPSGLDGRETGGTPRRFESR